MKIIKYKIFVEQDQFVQWQLEEKPEIIAVLPCYHKAILEHRIGCGPVESFFHSADSVFVTYYEEVKKEKTDNGGQKNQH